MSELRVAVLGVGVMGAFHAEALSSRVRGARVTVVSDFSADKAAEVAARVGARVETDPIAAINAADVDAVLVASPGAAHEGQVNACLDRGIPVLCEKPLTTDLASARAIVEREARSPRPLVQVGFMRRFDAEYVALKKLITDGELGNPLLVHCIHRNPNAAEYFNSDFMIRDSVVHEVDVARFLLEEEITSVQVIKGVATGAAPAGTNDPMLVIFETTSGRVITVEIFVRTGVAYEVRTEVVGERGSAMIGLDQNLVVKRPGGQWGGSITPGFVERFRAAYDLELQRWVDAARRGTIDGPGAWDGYAAVAVCEAGVEAVRTGHKVAVDLGARPTPRPEPSRPELVEGAPRPEPVEGAPGPELVEGAPRPEPEGAPRPEPEGAPRPELVEGAPRPEPEGASRPELVEGAPRPELEGASRPELVEGQPAADPGIAGSSAGITAPDLEAAR